MYDLTLEETLSHAVFRHQRRLVMVCAFHKEDSVLLDALVRIAPRTRVVAIDTGVLLPETLSAWRAFEERFGVQIEVAETAGTWTEESCCGEAKAAALSRVLDDADAWITGLRREQSPARRHARPIERDGLHGIWKYNPLAGWTEHDVWARIHERALPYHELHDRGFDTIGCAPCTARSTPLVAAG